MIGSLSLCFFVLFVLGWAYYMVATILMGGSIFVSMRLWIGRRAENSRVFRRLQEMLGCLMCTATEAAIWTLGVATFAIGIHYRAVSYGIGLVLNRDIMLPAIVEIALMVGVSFALSLAVAGEAWAIKTIVEHREGKFLALREEFRAREIELLQKIVQQSSGENNKEFEFDLS